MCAETFGESGGFAFVGDKKGLNFRVPANVPTIWIRLLPLKSLVGLIGCWQWVRQLGLELRVRARVAAAGSAARGPFAAAT
jgi:hypothetical protein